MTAKDNKTLVQLPPADAIPLPDCSVDLVTANGIYNLSPDKEAVMREVARVLRPGGRTVFAEIVLQSELPGEIRRELDGWGDRPQQSLTVFTALMLVCLRGAISARTVEGGRVLVATVAALLLAAGATRACIASAPPLPPTPKQSYDAAQQPFDMCRPPFPGA